MLTQKRLPKPQPTQELIDTLDTKPPRSFKHIRQVLRKSVKIIRQEVIKIEKEYVGDKKDLFTELQTWIVPLKTVMHAAHLADLSSSRTIDNILASPGISLFVDPIDLACMKDCVMKVREFVPFKFNRAVELTQKSLKILQKYCLSFYDMVNDVALGTAQDYHTNSISIVEKVKVLLERCRMMSYKFQTEVVLLRSDFFGTNARQIASRCQCENLPFLVMFPQVCDNLREVCSLLDRWIDADENYAGYIRNDIKDLERSRQQLVQKTRDLQENCYHLTYRYKMADQESLANARELSEAKEKVNELVVEEEMIRREFNDKRVDVEIKEFMKAELMRNSDTLIHSVYKEQLDAQTLEIKKLKDVLKILPKKVENVQYRLHKAEERQDELASKKNLSQTLGRELVSATMARQEAEMELSSVVEKFELAKRIYWHKTCVEMLEKIHYSLPLDTRSPRQSQSEEFVTFDRCCEVVAATIAGDWTRLYRTLPFVPARGQLNIEWDIANIVRANPRDGHAQHALRSLYRWRRFNNRAKADDVIVSLRQLKRHDVIAEVDYTLNPPVVNTKVEETPPPAFLARYLIPCYKEVERYDKLRATQKIPPLNWEATKLIL